MKVFLFLSLMAMALMGFSQNKYPTVTNKKCATDEIHKWRMENEPGYAESYAKLEAFTAKFVQEYRESGYSPKAVVTVPVVFHIVLSQTQLDNFPDSRIIEQVEVLNRDYSGNNIHGMGDFPTSLKVNTDLQFCLATIGPNGQPTTGIERKVYTGAPWGTDNGVKYTAQGGLDAWDPTQYLNFWIADIGNGLCGYALLPSNVGPEFGLVNHYEYTGVTGASAPYNLGGTGTHEIGHCFNLIHPWADDGGGCDVDDQCNDTPLQDIETYGDPTGILTDQCTPGGNGIMYMNFMDYVNDATYSNFTPDQKARIQACFAPGGPLELLGQSSKCGVPVVTDFQGTPTTINIGETVDFEDLSTGSPTAWDWSFPGAVTTTSSVQDPQNIQYNTAGLYTVTLTASKTNFTDTETKTNYIKVIDPNLVVADFEGVPTTVIEGGTVQFTDLTTGNPTQWAWTLQGGTPATSTAQNPLVTYNTPGIYPVQLIAKKTGQADTIVKVDYIEVLDSSYAPVADFIADYTVREVGDVVNFTNYSTGTYDSLLWVFEGGMPPASTVMNPTNVTYNNVGFYDVTLILYSGLGNDTLIKDDYIQVVDTSMFAPLTSDFHAISGRLIVQGWSVNYEDLSVGYPTDWKWIFEGGNPSTSTIQHPQNIFYSNPGIFDVTLIVSNGVSTDTLKKEDYIVVTTEPWPDPNGYCEDTISNVLSSERPLTFRHLAPNKWGYFPGHNEYTAKAYAEKYTNYTYTNIQSVIVPVVKAYGATSTGKVRFTVWDVDNNGNPGIELAKEDVMINTFTPYYFHTIDFDPPAPVNGEFFIGYQLFYNVPADTFVTYMSPNRGMGGRNTMLVKKGATWYTPSALLNDTLNTSMGFKIVGCLYSNTDVINWDNQLLIYPNPVNDNLNVQINDVDITSASIELFDISGRLVNAEFIEQDSGLYQVSVSNLRNGIYFIKLIVNGQPVTKKVSVIK